MYTNKTRRKPANVKDFNLGNRGLGTVRALKALEYSFTDLENKHKGGSRKMKYLGESLQE